MLSAPAKKILIIAVIVIVGLAVLSGGAYLAYYLYKRQKGSLEWTRLNKAKRHAKGIPIGTMVYDVDAGIWNGFFTVVTAAGSTIQFADVTTQMWLTQNNVGASNGAQISASVWNAMTPKTVPGDTIWYNMVVPASQTAGVAILKPSFSTITFTATNGVAYVTIT